MKVISVEGLSKSYRLGQIGTGTFTRDMQVWWARVRGRPNPLARIGEEGRAGENGSGELWALRDVSFEVEQGEVLGIIGRNGAGKSTLLKILSRVTAPTSGEVKVKGRIASLLEVGTGFHPELTGRENVYLNGAILGMSRKEIAARFEEIVDFSGVEKFIDTPVKRYSSGMYVRLAFAVAAHLDPEILVVDEVLAVGDAEFQKKCLGKMGEVAQGGRTVLFVSHNLGAVEKLCNKSLLLNSGKLQLLDATSEVISRYLQPRAEDLRHEKTWSAEKAPGDVSFKLRGVQLCQPTGHPKGRIDFSKPFFIEIETETLSEIPSIGISVQIRSKEDITIIHTADLSNSLIYRKQIGRQLTVCELPAHILNFGPYSISIAADIPYQRILFLVENVLHFEVEFADANFGRYRPTDWKGVTAVSIGQWSVRELYESKISSDAILGE